VSGIVRRTVTAAMITKLSLADRVADAANGVSRFPLTTGDRTGWDVASFSRRLAPTAAETSPAVRRAAL
jgi:hypothetical protein